MLLFSASVFLCLCVWCVIVRFGTGTSSSKRRQFRKEREHAAALSPQERLFMEVRCLDVHALDVLAGLLCGNGIARGRYFPHSFVLLSCNQMLKPAAVRCVYEMLAARPNINFRSDLVDLLVPLMNDKSTRVCVEVCAAAASLFAADPLGEVCE